MISKVGFSSNFQSQIITKNRNEIAFKGAVADLEPKEVWKHFDEMLPIYRESGHCEEISNHLAKKLTGYGFDVKQEPDGTGQFNVIATKNADKGKPVILQAHMDMVGVSNDGNTQKPIIPIIEGDKLRANDRTLGADNSLGLAMGLAIAKKTTNDSRFKDLPLKIIFTTDEEVGMIGAKALKKEDFAGSKYLINLDSEESNIITTGCAGIDLFEELKAVPMLEIGDNNHKKISISVENATGGHSGCDIHRGRINPITAVLSGLNKINSEDNNSIKLMNIEGGKVFNSIPTGVNAEMLVPQEKLNDVVSQLNADLEILKEKHKETDPKLSFNIKTDDSNATSNTKVVNPEFQTKLFKILGKDVLSNVESLYPNGDPKTSQNIGILKLRSYGIYDDLNFSVMARSSDDNERAGLKSKTSSQLSELLDKDVKPVASLPIWQPKLNSPLTNLAVEAYKKLNNTAPIVQVCHGGLETANFAEKCPELDQISIGPDISGPHSTQESTVISSTGKSYKLLENILLRLKPELTGKNKDN
jgi:dipeptidase D